MSSNLVRVKFDSSLPGIKHRGKSAALWRDAIENAVYTDGQWGTRFRDDFIEGVGDAHAESVGTSTGHAIDKIDAKNGVASITTNAVDAAGEGAIARFPLEADMIFDQQGRLIVEALVNLRIAPSWAIGLCESGEQFYDTSGAFNNADSVCIYRLDGGDIMFRINQEDTGGLESTEITILDADEITFVDGGGSPVDEEWKFGMALNPDGTVDVTVNGDPVNYTLIQQLDGNVRPVGLMTRAIQVTEDTGATAPGDIRLDVDWVESYQGPGVA